MGICGSKFERLTIEEEKQIAADYRANIARLGDCFTARFLVQLDYGVSTAKLKKIKGKYKI